jgi:hypothetical protein
MVNADYNSIAINGYMLACPLYFNELLLVCPLPQRINSA